MNTSVCVCVVYVFTYVYRFSCMCVFMRVRERAFLRMFICAHVCVFICVKGHAYLWMFICARVYVCVCCVRVVRVCIWPQRSKTNQCRYISAAISQQSRTVKCKLRKKVLIKLILIKDKNSQRKVKLPIRRNKVNEAKFIFKPRVQSD